MGRPQPAHNSVPGSDRYRADGLFTDKDPSCPAQMADLLYCDDWEQPASSRPAFLRASRAQNIYIRQAMTTRSTEQLRSDRVIVDELDRIKGQVAKHVANIRQLDEVLHYDAMDEEHVLTPSRQR